LGLQPLNTVTWMQQDGDFQQFNNHKLSVYQQHPEKVSGALPGSESAQAEFHCVLMGHLVDHHGLKKIENIRFASLWQSSLLVQEDICLLEPNANGQYLLTAASVCSPSNWKLEDKLGRDLDLIHAPVPGYDKELSERVNRLFGKLKVDSPLLRYNWSIQADNELFWRNDLSADRKTQAVEPHWYWRVERQTLRRLPETQTIVFTIRIYLHNLRALRQHPAFGQQLRHMIAGLPEKQIQYKGLMAWLNSGQ